METITAELVEVSTIQCDRCGLTAREVNNIRSNGFRHDLLGWVERNPDVVCCQTWYEWKDDTETFVSVRSPSFPDVL